MPDSKDENTDGSSILPVSSLRSRFEQMANISPSTAAPPSRPISPRPKSMLLDVSQTSQFSSPRSSLDLPRPDATDLSRGRNINLTGPASLRPVRTTQSSISPSPTRPPRPVLPSRETTVPTSSVVAQTPPGPPPSVTIEPPRSPPKNLNLTISNPSAFLSTDSPKSASMPALGESSPRHFRIPSRPHTPLVETRRSPQPPEPPPPRRSGELRRDPSVKITTAPPPPPAKPRLFVKPADSTENVALQATSPNHNGGTSPFTTPPSSPERYTPPQPRNKPAVADPFKISSGKLSFEPPPVHHAIVAKRRDQDDSLHVRADVTPGDLPSQRPALPARRDTPIAEAAPKTGQTTMLPPPRPSIDAVKPVIHSTIKKPAIQDTPGIIPPPRRISSTPSYSNTIPLPTRPNGRSATINQTSERAPPEFRVPPIPTANKHANQEPEAGPTRAESFPKSMDYPDASRSNRRAPFLSYGPKEIGTKYETRVFDVCGQYVCTSGFFTRVWNLLNGELMMSLSHGETVKILSVIFKPAAELQQEGNRLWLGNNLGELVEIDIATQNIVASQSTAHARREVIKIYRYQKQMWTLDDSGGLHVWGPDSSGAPNLTNPHQSFRLPKDHTFSMVVDHDLWHATGKEIRIFRPNLDGKAQFQVLTKALVQANAGEVTSGTTMPGQPEVVYLGHNDGKVSMYSRRNYSCLGLVSVSQYKINTLSGVGDNLWAGYSRGSICVYDTRQSPWVIKKDWYAHDKPVIGILNDRSSFWMLDRAHVVSLGADNSLRFWDGLLQDDWLEDEMHSRDSSYCTFEQLKALVMTWNAGASTPHSLRYTEEDSNFFRELLQNSDSPDILVFGFQELVDLEDKKTTAKSFFKSSKKRDASEQVHMSHQYRDWRDYLTRCLDDYMPNGELYHLLHTASLVGLFTCIFVKASIRERIKAKSIHGSEVKRGMGGFHGNKGALIIRFLLDDTSLCFINCHLAAGQTQTAHRNNDVAAILESSALPAERDAHVKLDNFICGGDGSMITDHEICILNGDLNYRIDTMGRDIVVNAVKNNNLSKLLERDQLLVSRRKNPSFPLRFFHELPIKFAPTYKYDVGTDNYDTSEKKRSPAWCDRVLSRGGDRVQQLDYRRHEVRVSDHRPVTAMFSLVVKKIDPQRRATTWEECQRAFEEVRTKQARASRLDFLENICGMDASISEQVVRQQ